MEQFNQTWNNESRINVTNTSSTSHPVAAAVSSPTWSAIVLSTLQWVIFVVGTLGNLLVLVVLIWRRSPKQLVTQLFVCSLSVADLGLLLVVGWAQAVQMVVDSYPFGRDYCRLQTIGQVLFTYTYIWTLAVLTIDRYLGLNKASKQSSIKLSWAIATVVLIWVIIFAINIPTTIWSDVVVVGGSLRCQSAGVDPNVQTTFVVVGRIINYWIPMVITWASYVLIIIRIRSTMKKVGDQVGTAANSQQTSARKVTLMCLAIATSFTVTTMPLQMTIYVQVYGDRATANRLFIYLRLLMMFDICLHPIIYGVMWRPFRTSLIQLSRQICCGCSGKQKMTTHITSLSTANNAPTST